jgi:hypothetical protein
MYVEPITNVSTDVTLLSNHVCPDVSTIGLLTPLNDTLSSATLVIFTFAFELGVNIMIAVLVFSKEESCTRMDPVSVLLSLISDVKLNPTPQLEIWIFFQVCLC